MLIAMLSKNYLAALLAAAALGSTLSTSRETSQELGEPEV
jgi:hypothetical protein